MTLSLAVIGCGMGAKPHGGALRALAGRVAVRGVYARTPTRRAAFAAEFDFPEADSLEALVRDPAVDAALVLTPPNAREEIVGAFARAGKHVLSEKPLERSVAAAERIVAACADVHLGVVFQHRFREASVKLAALVADGALGPIRLVRVEVPWWRDQGYYDEPGRGTYARDGGGVLISQAIHTLDLMLSVTGPVTAVQGLTATTGFHRMEAEDFAAGGMVFASGAVGAVMVTTAAWPGDAESIALDCDRASVLLKSGVLTVNWRDGRAETFGASATTGGGADPMAFPHHWHEALIADFAEAVETGRAPRVTGADGLAVQRLIAGFERSSREGRRIEITPTT